MNTTTPPLTTTPVQDQVPVTVWEPRTYPGTLAHLRTLRHDLTQDLTGFTPDLIDTVRLCASELLANAVKYTDTGGEIGLSLAREGRQAVVRVWDTGIGIAPDLLPRVFELYTQGDTSARREGGGLGIGLSLVRQLVELHKGNVEAASDGPGHGATLEVRLPVLSEAQYRRVRWSAGTGCGFSPISGRAGPRGRPPARANGPLSR